MQMGLDSHYHGAFQLSQSLPKLDLLGWGHLYDSRLGVRPFYRWITQGWDFYLLAPSSLPALLHHNFKVRQPLPVLR